MFFKNLLTYRLNFDTPLQADALEQALANVPAKPCGSQTLETYGFVPPINEDGAPLVRQCQGFLIIAARHEKRMLPGSAVRDAVTKKVAEIEAAEGRKISRKEKSQIKDEVVLALLPRAFIKTSIIHAAIDPEKGLLYVDSSSTNKAEEFLSAMRQALTTLPVRPVSVKVTPPISFTQWLRTQHIGNDLVFLDECELRDTAEDGGIVRIKRDDLLNDEIKGHLDAGKVAVNLRLGWEDKLEFTLDDKLAIKRLRFSGVLHEQSEADGGDEASGQFDASFIIMMLTLREFMPALLEVLGGEEVPQT